MATITITTVDLHEAGALLSTLYKRRQLAGKDGATTPIPSSPYLQLVRRINRSFSSKTKSPDKLVKAALRRAETKVKAKKRRTKAKPGTQTAKIRTLSRKGLKIAQIAARLKINSGTVWHALHG